MKKSDAEKALRHLCHEWGKAHNIRPDPTDHPSFSAFKRWLSENGYSHYLSFRSRMGADYDAEMWFDQEFKQTWRR